MRDRVGRRGGTLVALAWLYAAEVRAADAATDRCLAADAIHGLEVGERRDLADTCRRGAAPATGLVALLARVVARADWTSTSLADLLRGGAPLLDLGGTSGDGERLARVRGGLARLPEQLGACKPVEQALDNFYDGVSDPPTPPFTANSLASCGFGGDELAGLALLTIPVDAADAGLFVAAGAGERTVLQWFAAREAFVHRGRRVFVVAVPRWSVVSVQLDAAPAPQRWHGYVPYHRVVWAEPPPSGCLRLSVDLDPDTTLLLDGRPLARGTSLAHRTVPVGAGTHGLVALRCGGSSAGGGCSEHYRETLPAIDAAARDNLCRDVALDLRDRRIVTLLEARAAPGCDAALAWRAGERARAYLKRSEAQSGLTFRDLASYASITQALVGLRDSLNPEAGRALGAATGGDSLDEVASVAKEAWRHGIGELVTLELRCSGAALELAATVISARKLQERQLGPIAGADLGDLLRVHSLEFAGEAQLTSTVESLIDQLFARPYVRFREDREDFHYRQPVDVDSLSSYAGQDFRVYPVRPDCTWTDSDKTAPPRRGRLALDSVRRISADASATDPEILRYRHRVVARQPGAHVAVARQDGSAARRCLRFTVPRSELWASLMFAPDLSLRTPVVDLVARHGRVAIGRTWYLRRAPWFGLGVAGGYAFTHHRSRTGVPGWQDLTVEPAARTASLAWSRHALIAGPLLEFRSRRADLPVEFRGRLSALAGFALIDVSAIADFPEFSGAAQFGTTNVRVRSTVDALVELGVSAFAGRLAITPMLTLGAVALSDMTSGKWALTALGGAGLFAGVGLHLGGAP